MTTIYKYKHITIEVVDTRKNYKEKIQFNNFGVFIIKWNKYFASIIEGMKYIDSTRMETEPYYTWDMLKYVKTIDNTGKKL